MISAVIFDLDETILDRRTSLTAFLADQHSEFFAGVGHPSLTLWIDRFLSRDADGRVHKSLVYPALLSEFGCNPDLAEALLRYYNERCCRYAQATLGTEETLGALRKAGLPLAIVTNGETEFQMRQLDSLGLTQNFNAILVSQAEGLRKPDPTLFIRAATRIAVNPDRCLFVGDDPEADILGAHAVGMQTAWVQRGRVWPEHLPPPPGSVIDKISEISRLIGEHHDH